MVTASIIIPVYNERRTLLEIVRRLERTQLPVQKEIILVDDCSTDGSTELVRTIGRTRHHRVYFHSENRGKGAALRTGYRHATGKYLLAQDADLEYDPADYRKLLAPLLAGDATVVYGSRFLGKRFRVFGKRAVFLPAHYFGNKFLILLTNLLFGSTLTEMETCYKAFPRNLLRQLQLESDGFEETPELTGKILKLGYHIHEVPVSYRPRGYAEGKKIRWRDGLAAILMLFKIRFFWQTNPPSTR